MNAMQSKSKRKAHALPLLRLLPVHVTGVQADTDCWAAEACVLAQVRRTEDALRAAPGNATLRMLLWYQVRVLLPAHALPPCRHAFRTDVSCFPQIWAASWGAPDRKSLRVVVTGELSGFLVQGESDADTEEHADALPAKLGAMVAALRCMPLPAASASARARAAHASTSLMSTGCLFCEGAPQRCKMQQEGCMKLPCHTVQASDRHSMNSHVMQAPQSQTARRAQGSRVQQVATASSGKRPAALVKRVRAGQLTTLACWHVRRTQLQSL